MTSTIVQPAARIGLSFSTWPPTHAELEEAWGQWQEFRLANPTLTFRDLVGHQAGVLLPQLGRLARQGRAVFGDLDTNLLHLYFRGWLALSQLETAYYQLGDAEAAVLAQHRKTFNAPRPRPAPSHHGDRCQHGNICHYCHVVGSQS